MEVHAPHGLMLMTLVAVIVIPLERLLPVRRQSLLRPHMLTDGLHLVLTSAMAKLFFQLVFGLVLLTFVFGVNRLVASEGLRARVAAQPFLLQFAEAMVVYEFFGYWSHRASHEWRWWWRFHSIHHSSTTLDWLATPRLHFVDQGLRQIVKLTPLVLLGFTRESFGLVAVVGPVLTFLIHANARLHWGPLRFIYTSPQFHHWHHALIPTNKNYSDQFPWMDALFGTLHLPRGQWPNAYGIAEPMPASWWRQMLLPFATLRSGPASTGKPPAYIGCASRSQETEQLDALS